MKLLRYGEKGAERPSLLDVEGNIRDLSSVVPDITPAVLSGDSLAALKALNHERLPVVDRSTRFGVPVSGIGKIVCVGLNYEDHAREAGLPVPDEPVLFLKACSSLTGSSDRVVLPPGSTRSDWEVELAIVIGRIARCIPTSEAISHIAGYCVLNDLSERSYQLERGGQWDKGKGCDTFGPLGPWVVTRDEVNDPQNLEMWLEVNGCRMQSGNTRSMIFGVAEVTSYVSQFWTLYPGDVISTGTPPGVGHGQKPPMYLKPGDTVRLGIAGLGEQTQQVVAWDPALLDQNPRW